MKYSQQQLKDINRRYANINRSVKLTNQRANGIQSIIVDQVIPEDLLDARNQNDIENDEFAKRALLNKYSREILGTGDIYDFQKKLIDSGLEKTFLNQFPEVLKESKNFRKPTVNNVINITQRIYNKNIHELNLLSSNKRRQENNDNLLAILEVISDNLGQLIQLYPRQQNQIQDQLNRVDATITTAQTVDDPDSFFGSLFGNDPADVADGLNQIAQITDPNQIDPNSQVAPVIDPVGILAGISQSGLTEALESASSNISSAKSRAKKVKVIEFDPLEIWKEGDQNFTNLEKAVKSKTLDEETFAEKLSELTGFPVQSIRSEGNKKQMYEYVVGKIRNNMQTTQKGNTTSIKNYLSKSNYKNISDFDKLKKIATDLKELTNNEYNYNLNTRGVNGIKIKKSINYYAENYL
jgi:hypothetical protein